MCGICGFVRMRKESHYVKSLSTRVLNGISERGTDASGVGILYSNNQIRAMKNSIPSYLLTRSKEYKNLMKLGKWDMMVGHARFATHGDSKLNINNHPHWSENLRYILVHNGVVMGGDKTITQKCTSSCDSEIILKYIEEYGVLEGYKKLEDDLAGSYAILLMDNWSKEMYFFVNHGSPLVYAFIPELSGYYFASTKAILSNSLSAILAKKEIAMEPFEVVEVEPHRLYKIKIYEEGVEEVAKGWMSNHVSSTYTFKGGLWARDNEETSRAKGNRDFYDDYDEEEWNKEYKRYLAQKKKGIERIPYYHEGD